MDARTNGSCSTRHALPPESSAGTEDISAFARQQGRLLDALWQVLAPGGKLLYVTCSVFAEENADVVRDWLSRTPDAHPLDLPDFPGTGGVLLPSPEHDGFFYALLQRR
jgi:16S rRNA (cytosine967-C5)-methyltransferase